MKKYFIIMTILFSALSILSAQERGMGGRRFEKDRERIEELERVKLIETLDMNEETSIKFFARRKEFNDKMKDLNRQKDEKLDQLQKFINDNGEKSDQAYKKQIDEVTSIDRELIKSRAEFFNSLKDILSYKQISKLLVFERKFRRDLRDLILRDRKRNLRQN